MDDIYSVLLYVGLLLLYKCRFIAPIEGVGLIIWWIVEEIVTNTST